MDTMERIQLSNVSFEGDNNVYLFAGAEPTLIDTGDWMPDTCEQLQSALAHHDLTFGDIEQIFLTHWHGDHVGLAGNIQEAGGASVYIHERDAPLVGGDERAWDEVSNLHERRFEEWGIPPEGQETLRAIFDAGPDPAEAPTVTPFENGDTFDIGSETITAVHAPGHAAGLCLFEWGTEVFSGDALLPKYTPNVGGADLRVDRPLAQYLDTLEMIERKGYDSAWPGHRDAIDDPAERAREIVIHHEERAYRVLEALSRLEPADPWTVSADLFGDLESIHILHGPGESYAHLEHLERAGHVEREGRMYRLTAKTESAIETIEDGRWPL